MLSSVDIILQLVLHNSYKTGSDHTNGRSWAAFACTRHRKEDFSAVTSAESCISAEGDITGWRRANTDATRVNRRAAQRRGDSRLYYAITWLWYAGGWRG